MWFASRRKLSLEPTTIEFEFNMSDAVRAGVTFSLDDGFSTYKNATADVSGDVRIIEMGRTCLKVYAGPDIEVGLDLGIAEASVGARLDGFIEGCVQPELSSTCTKLTETIDGGIEGSLSGSIGVFGASIEGELPFELYRANIASFTQTLRDTAPPTISADNMTVPTAPGQCSQKVTYALNVEDTCSGVAGVTCVPPTGSVLAKGVTPVMCTATDNKGNSAATSFTVTVVDNEAPKFTALLTDIARPTEPGLCSAVVTYQPPSATDNCPGAVTVACAPPSGSTFEKGVTVVNCKATDVSQNVAASSFKVTVRDNEKPALLSAPDLYVLAAPGSSATIVNLAPQASDNCPGLQVVLDPPSGSAFPIGPTLVNGKLIDAAGNVTDFSFVVNVYNIFAIDDSTGGVFRAIWDGGNLAQYEYYDCRKGVLITGKMEITSTSCKVEGRDTGDDPKKPDRNVYVLFNRCTFESSGWVQYGGITYNFYDADVRNDIALCR